MKKLFVYGAFVLALTACKNDKTTTKTDDKSTPATTTGTSGSYTPSTTTPSTTEGTTSSSSNGWSQADREAFMKTCSEGAANTIGKEKAMDYCGCMGEKLEKMYPNPNDASGMTEEAMAKVAEDCPR